VIKINHCIYKENLLYSKASRSVLGVQSASYSMVIGDLITKDKEAGNVKLNIRLNLVPTLRMCGAIPPHPHVSTACIGTVSHLRYVNIDIAIYA
jgi:hypothetical protein